MKKEWMIIGLLFWGSLFAGCGKGNSIDFVNGTATVEAATMEQTEIFGLDQQIKRTLKMPVSEILKETDSQIEEGLLVFSPNLPYPIVEVENASFLIICQGYDETACPAYVTLYAEYEKEYLKILSLDDEKSLYDIMAIMGETELMESPEKNGIPEYKNYMIMYERNGLQYSFISDNPEEKGFRLFIGMAQTDGASR